ncbi:hypothetical protein GQ457_10G000810 [Hibiscus cannabinus]
MQGLSKTGRSDVPEVLVFEILHRLPVKSLTRFNDFTDKVALWNPSTREFKIHPQSNALLLRVIFPIIIFVTIHFGGYDKVYDGYVEFDRNEKVELYSLRSDSWKEISHPGVTGYGPLLINNYINGFYYWLAVGHYEYEISILSFDMVTENFSILPLPLPTTSGTYYLDLLDFNGLLGALLPLGEGTEKSFDIWVMNGSWTKQFTIDSVPGVERALGFWKNGELFLESSDHELVLFDPSTRELKNLGIHAYMGTMRISAYVENLVPINGRSEYEEHIIRRLPGGASN